MLALSACGLAARQEDRLPTIRGPKRFSHSSSAAPSATGHCQSLLQAHLLHPTYCTTMSLSSLQTRATLKASCSSKKDSSCRAPPPAPPRWLHTVMGKSPPARAMGEVWKAQTGRGSAAWADREASMRAWRESAAGTSQRCSREVRSAPRAVRERGGEGAGGGIDDEADRGEERGGDVCALDRAAEDSLLRLSPSVAQLWL